MMRVAPLLALAVFLNGITVASQNASPGPKVTVSELRKAEPKGLVVVTGCYTLDFEAQLLFACEEASYLPIAGIWLDTIDSVSPDDSNILRPKAPINEKQLEFKKGKWGKYNPVVLLGQYQTGGHFGHMDMYSSRFIVHQIISEGSPQEATAKGTENSKCQLTSATRKAKS